MRKPARDWSWLTLGVAISGLSVVLALASCGGQDRGERDAAPTRSAIAIQIDAACERVRSGEQEVVVIRLVGDANRGWLLSPPYDLTDEWLVANTTLDRTARRAVLRANAAPERAILVAIDGSSATTLDNLAADVNPGQGKIVLSPGTSLAIVRDKRNSTLRIDVVDSESAAPE